MAATAVTCWIDPEWKFLICGWIMKTQYNFFVAIRWSEDGVDGGIVECKPIYRMIAVI